MYQPEGRSASTDVPQRENRPYWSEDQYAQDITCLRVSADWVTTVGHTLDALGYDFRLKLRNVDEEMFLDEPVRFSRNSWIFEVEHNRTAATLRNEVLDYLDHGGLVDLAKSRIQEYVE